MPCQLTYQKAFPKKDTPITSQRFRCRTAYRHCPDHGLREKNAFIVAMTCMSNVLQWCRQRRLPPKQPFPPYRPVNHVGFPGSPDGNVTQSMLVPFGFEITLTCRPLSRQDRQPRALRWASWLSIITNPRILSSTTVRVPRMFITRGQCRTSLCNRNQRASRDVAGHTALENKPQCSPAVVFLPRSHNKRVI